MIKKLNLKLFIENPEALDVKAVIPVFHGWIRDNLLDGLPIDVADYKHVPNGPGLMLIGHDGDYAIDFANGRSGLWYSHKREWAASNRFARTNSSGMGTSHPCRPTAGK